MKVNLLEDKIRSLKGKVEKTLWGEGFESALDYVLGLIEKQTSGIENNPKETNNNRPSQSFDNRIWWRNPPTSGFKKCNVCKLWFPLDSYPNHKATKDGKKSNATYVTTLKELKRKRMHFFVGKRDMKKISNFESKQDLEE